MKKVLLVCLAVGLVLSFGSIAMAALNPGTGIIATYHDLSSSGAGAALGDTADHAALNRICVYCHAPHNTLKPDTVTGLNSYRPLWNHNPSLNTTFTMYTNGPDMPNQPQHQSQAMLLLGAGSTPGSVSMLCLSCHDGSTATNSYGYTANLGASKGAADKSITARATIGANGDLSNHHPIGFNYDQVAGIDDEIHVSTHAVAQGGAGGVQIGGPATVADLLWNGNVECVSCHDVHNTKNGGLKFLWVEDTQSALCLTCHVKDGTVQ